MRIRRLLAVALLILSLAATAAPAASQAAPPQRTAAATPIAILGLFEDDENEPDENEADEGGGSNAQESDDEGSSAGISLVEVGLVLAFLAIAGAWLARWFFRIRSWIRRPAS
jgi:hypothetical protein